MGKWLFAGLALALAPPAVAAEEKPATEKKICKKTKDTTSRARTVRICMTQEAWDKQASESQQNLRESQRHINLEREGA